MDKNQLNSILRILIEAGSAIVDIYGRVDLRARLKPDNTPVTMADQASSRILNEGLTGQFPDIPIIDEEHQIPAYEVRKNWKRYFLIDPQDGTKEFIKRNGEFCINLALMENNRPVEGWIYQPLTQKGWYCKSGEGIFMFGADLTLLPLEQKSTKHRRLRIVTSRSFFKPKEAVILDELKKKYQIELIHKGSSLKQVGIISGESDMYLKAGPCSEWDTAPGQLMVEEFGGVVLKQSDFQVLGYNKPKMVNPHFVMLNSRLNEPGFLAYLKELLHSLSD